MVHKVMAKNALFGFQLSKIRFFFWKYDTLLESYSRKELKVMYVERQIRDVIRAKK